MNQSHTQPPSFWRSPAGGALALVAVVGGYYLVTEHSAHLYGALPYVVLLACPLMHVFLHSGRRHKGHDRGQHRSNQDEQRRQ